MVHMDSINDEELNTPKSNNDFAPLTPTSDSNSIILYPFAHQVGGHTQLLTLDKSTLCKPLIPRELLFYLNVPKELVKFVPAYKGVVQIRENGQGTYPPVVYQPLRSPKSPFAKYKPGLCCNDNLNEDYLSEDDSSQSVTDMCGFPFELKVQIRPCPDEKILKKNLSQDNLLRADYISRPNEKYLLLLENVASKYQLPCILDLKMGTRQHGDDATEEKRHRQIAKCQASTSASLGVRLCGMQVYQVDYGGFIWYDKYYGRKMDEDGLKRALQEYFRNGSQINGDIIDDVIDRLKLLSNAVEKSPSFRFYGTSLLIIHEGCTTSRNNNSKYNNSNNDNISNTATTTTTNNNITTDTTKSADTTAATNTTTTTNTNTTNNNNNKNISNSKSKRCQVDVRLIDFAHTICDCNYTNGRSSSSPSVLTSSSAEQLSSTASSMLAPLTISPTPAAPMVTKAVVAPTTAINDDATIDNADIIISDDDDQHPNNQSQRLINSENLLEHHHETNNHSPDSCLEEDLDLDLDLTTADGAGNDVVDAGCGVKVGIGLDVGIGDNRGDHDSDAHNDTENYHPDQRVSITTASHESDIEYNNNIANNNNTAIISNNSSNNNGFNNAFKPPIFKHPHPHPQPQLQPQLINRYHYSSSVNNRHHLNNHHHHYHPPPHHHPAAATLETLREVDQQIASSTKSKTNKQQISSTPTTPPSIGNRKISKTSIGPDKGLLFGLENLMRLLDDLKNETLLSY